MTEGTGQTLDHREGQDASLSALTPQVMGDLLYPRALYSPRLHGSHLMPLPRPSRSLPESSRAYLPGDPPAMIDWRAYARTDQLLIRERREESSALVRIIVEDTPTLDWPDVQIAVDAPRKREIVARVAISLAYQHARLGDRVELWLWNGKDELPSTMFSARAPSDFLQLFRQGEIAQWSAESFREGVMTRIFREDRGHVHYWIGDMLAQVRTPAWFMQLKKPCLLHILSHLEVDVNWLDRDANYFDASVYTREFRGRRLRNDEFYLDAIHSWCSSLERTLKLQGGDYVRLTDRSSISALVQFLEHVSQPHPQGTVHVPVSNPKGTTS